MLVSLTKGRLTHSSTNKEFSITSCKLACGKSGTCKNTTVEKEETLMKFSPTLQYCLSVLSIHIHSILLTGVGIETLRSTCKGTF